MEQRKIEHITLHLIVFGTIAIIGVLARQTVLHMKQKMVIKEALSSGTDS